MQIEFFHDVFCSFCYPMSCSMRQIDQTYQDIEVIHRSFALGWEEKSFIQQFGSRQAVKEEVVQHWAQANTLDEGKRFNIEAMLKTDFDFPLSRRPLIAAEAAELVGGSYDYWEAFDALQKALFTDNLNIEDPEIIDQIIQKTSLDFDRWKSQVEKKETMEAVIQDLMLCQSLGIHSAPSILVDRQYLFKGALSVRALDRRLNKIAEENGQVLT